MPNIIVVLCSHNGERYILEQLLSITEQSLKPDRLFLYDFNSSDNTRDIINKFSKNYNGSIEIILNYLDFAKGANDSFFYSIKDLSKRMEPHDVLFFSDQDDVWLKEKIETQTSLYLAQTAAHKVSPLVLFHDVEVVDEYLQSIDIGGNSDRSQCLNKDMSLSDLIFGNCAIGHTMLINHSLTIRLAEVYDHNQFAMHDWAAMLLAKSEGNIVYLAEKLTKYRQHDSNVLGSNTVRSRGTFFQLIEYGQRIVDQTSSLLNMVGFDSLPFSLKLLKVCRKSNIIFKFLLSSYCFLFVRNNKKKMLSVFILLGLFKRHERK